MKKTFRFHCVVLVSLLFILTAASPSSADQVINADLIVSGKLCVGSDCQNGEAFGIGRVIILKQNDPRLVSESTVGFANWYIVNAPPANGGINSFALMDPSSGSRLFNIEAGAPDHSLYVRETGQLGMGTSNPTRGLQVEGGAFFSGTMEVASSGKFKESVMDMEAVTSRKALKALRPVKYKYKNDPSDASLGFIAEELPSIVTTKDGKTINPVDIIAVLTRVIQEQRKTMAVLTNRISDLERDVLRKSK